MLERLLSRHRLQTDRARRNDRINTAYQSHVNLGGKISTSDGCVGGVNAAEDRLKKKTRQPCG